MKKGRKGRQIIRISDDGTETLYPSLSEAAREAGVKGQSIDQAAKFGYRSCGYRWRWADGTAYVKRERHDSPATKERAKERHQTWWRKYHPYSAPYSPHPKREHPIERIAADGSRTRYASIAEASRAHGIPETTLQAAVKRKSGWSHGARWRYIDTSPMRPLGVILRALIDLFGIDSDILMTMLDMIKINAEDVENLAAILYTAQSKIMVDSDLWIDIFNRLKKGE